MIKRYKFLDIFKENLDGSLTPRRAINVNGVIFGPGVAFGPGVSFGGVNFHRYKHLDIAAEEQEDGVLIIKGFFRE